MKIVVQIPFYNEASTLPAVLSSIPRHMPGIDDLEILVLDDGSTDDTGAIALRHGAHHVLRNTQNIGLAHTFRRGVSEALKKGADIIVNIDGDNQYRGEDIPRLIAPILAGQADMVIGDRGPGSLPHFSRTKRVLQRLGTFIVRKLSRIDVHDATSGFRAFSREAAIKLTILSNYTYTLESILQARSKGLSLANVKVAVNPTARPSRLMTSIRNYLIFSAATIIRIFSMYNPLRVFMDIGGLFVLAGVLIAARFLFYYFSHGGAGHLQSLIFAAIFTIIGMTIILVGLLADITQFNRRLLEDILERVKRLELEHGRSTVK